MSELERRSDYLAGREAGYQERIRVRIRALERELADMQKFYAIEQESSASLLKSVEQAEWELDNYKESLRQCQETHGSSYGADWQNWKQAEQRARDAEEALELLVDDVGGIPQDSGFDGLRDQIARLKAEKASTPVAVRDRPLAIPVSMRLPTQEDANDYGRVGVYEGGIWDTYPWDELPDRASAWARIPDKPCSCEGSECELCNWRRIDNTPPENGDEE